MAIFGVLCGVTMLCGVCKVLVPSSERSEPLKGLRRRNPMAAGLRLYGDQFWRILRLTGCAGVVAALAVIVGALLGVPLK